MFSSSSSAHGVKMVAHGIMLSLYENKALIALNMYYLNTKMLDAGQVIC